MGSPTGGERAPLPDILIDEAARDLDETAFLDADGGAATAGNRKKGKKAGVPNWAPMEAVACVWAQIAQCEEEQQQSLAKLQSGAMARYLGKAKDLQGKGKWNLRLTGGRTPEQSAGIRAGPGCEPNSFWAKAEKIKSVVINHIVPLWWQVQDEQHSGWDEAEKMKETLKRCAMIIESLLACAFAMEPLSFDQMFVVQVLAKSHAFPSLRNS